MKKQNAVKKYGFTLLELLIAVLIIGLLAAIALPKYQMIIDKAEFRKYQTMVHSIRTAYDDYLLTNNTHPKKFTDLSINLPSDFYVSDSRATYSYICISNNDMHCCMTQVNNNMAATIYCMKKNYTFGYLEEILTKKDANYSNRKECFAMYPTKTSSRQHKLCKEITSSTPDRDITLFTPSTSSYLGLSSYAHFPIK